MRSLPFYTVLLLSVLVLAWNYSRDDFGSEGIDLVLAAAGDEAGAEQASMRERSAVSAAMRDRPASELVPLESRSARERLRGARDDAALLGGARSAERGFGPGGAGDGPPENWVHVVEKYPNGQKRAAGYRAEGQRVGYWVEWFEGGEIQSEGAYANDEPEGEWVHYHGSGGVHILESYAGGELSGIRTTWGKNGALVEEGAFERGLPAGVWVQWYSNGQVRSSGRFVDGKRTGEWEFYDYDGRVDIRTGTYHEGSRVGE